MTVCFNGLGNEGRLGNQMFQYAFIRGMSKKHGYDFMIPHQSAERYDNYGLFECFELEGCKYTGEGIFKTFKQTIVVKSISTLMWNHKIISMFFRHATNKSILEHLIS